MDNNDIRAAAQKELMRRKATAELERRRAAQPQQPQVGVGEDMAKGFGAGVAQGAIGLPGAFGDVAQINSNLLSGGAKYLGAPEWAQNAAGVAGKAMMGPLGFMPTSEQITKPVEAMTGPLYEAQTTPGQYAQTAGQFAPAALLGPGKLAQKAAPAMAGALMSETAGQATKDTAAEPYARLAGGLLGGASVAAPRRAALKQMRETAPSLEKVGAQTDAAYARLRDAGIQFDENSYRSFAMRVMSKLQKHGWRPRDGDPISGDVKEIQGLVGKPVNWDEAESLRQFVGNLPKTASNKDFARAAIIRDELDAFINHGKVISTKGVLSGGETISSPAVRVNGKIYTGANHGEATELAAKKSGLSIEQIAQDFEADGFKTSTGRYVDRQEAFKIANKEKQLKRGVFTEEDVATNSGSMMSHGFNTTKDIDPKTIAALTSEARELGRRNILGKQIDRMTDKSEWYLAGDESGLKNQVSSFGKREGRSLQPAEKAALKKVVRREGVNSILSTTGGRLGQLLLGAAAFPTGGLLGTGAALGTHLVARKISEAKTQKAVKQALQTILAGRAAQKNALGKPRLLIQGNARRLGLLGAASQSGN